jgi:hypothetical protein
MWSHLSCLDCSIHLSLTPPVCIFCYTFLGKSGFPSAAVVDKWNVLLSSCEELVSEVCICALCVILNRHVHEILTFIIIIVDKSQIMLYIGCVYVYVPVYFCVGYFYAYFQRPSSSYSNHYKKRFVLQWSYISYSLWRDYERIIYFRVCNIYLSFDYTKLCISGIISTSQVLVSAIFFTDCRKWNRYLLCCFLSFLPLSIQVRKLL